MSNTPKANDMMPSETPSKTTTTNRSAGHAAGLCPIAIAVMTLFSRSHGACYIGKMTGIVPPGQGHLLTARGNVMAFKAVAEQTGGDFSLMERTVPPGGRTPPPHRHVTCSEAFFVLAGTITFRLDDAEPTGGAGDFLLVPRGAAHTFGNRGAEPARLLVRHAPAMDAHFAGPHKLRVPGAPP